MVAQRANDHNSRNLAVSPDDRTVATTILKTLPEYQRLQKLVNQTLAEQLPKNLCKKSRRFAIDLVLIPYHGEHCYKVNEIYRSQPKSGTSHFHAYATVCVLHKGFRYTVALTPVVESVECLDIAALVIEFLVEWFIKRQEAESTVLIDVADLKQAEFLHR